MNYHGMRVFVTGTKFEEGELENIRKRYGKNNVLFRDFMKRTYMVTSKNPETGNIETVPTTVEFREQLKYGLNRKERRRLLSNSKNWKKGMPRDNSEHRTKHRATRRERMLARQRRKVNG